MTPIHTAFGQFDMRSVPIVERSLDRRAETTDTIPGRVPDADEDFEQRRARWARMDPLDRLLAARGLRDAELRREAGLARVWLRRALLHLAAVLGGTPSRRLPRL